MKKEIAYFALVSNFDPLSKKLRSLWENYKDWFEIFRLLENEFKIKKDWEKEWKEFEDMGGYLWWFDELPENLKNIKPEPLALFVLGKTFLEERIILGIVGTRKASEEGKNIAKSFAFKLAQAGLLIVSGAAFGIDTASHLGAIEAKKETIAIIGEGIDVFLKRRKNLASKILDNGGMIVSEYALGTPGFSKNFPERNRLIAGLSNGILLIEVPEKSGALITANFALEYGKDIFVVPHSIYHKNYFGGLKLVQKGAYLVLSPEDILEHYGLDYNLKQDFSLNEKERKILSLIEKEPKTLNDLVRESDFNIEEILSILTFLEMKKLIINRAGYFYIRK